MELKTKIEYCRDGNPPNIMEFGCKEDTMLVWVTNCHTSEITVTRDSSSFMLFEGEPKSTSTYSTSELQLMGMVGLYKTAEDEECNS